LASCQRGKLRIICRILPEGEIAADLPTITPATGPIRQSQQLVASNAAAASKAAVEEKAAKAAAPGLLGDYRALCKPIHLKCSIEGLAGGRQGRVALKGLWHKAKPRGAYGPKGAGRWLHHLKEMARIVCFKNGELRPLSITSCICASFTVCACTLPCFAHACFCVMHSLYSLLIQLKVHTGTKLGKFNGELALASSMRTVLIKIKNDPAEVTTCPRANSAAS
jgi:hypothetical protein